MRFEGVDPVRSRMMAAVRSKDTKPEMLVRRRLHAEGYRYRVHGKGLPGRPDLAFPSRRKALFLHGCFWHWHPGCAKARPPRTRLDYWIPKLERNRERDAQALAALSAKGWSSLVVWECGLNADPAGEFERIRRFLGPPGRGGPASR